MSNSGSAFSRFIREARRRRVFRTAGLYVVGAWLLLQLAEVLFPGFGIPDAAMRALLWALVLGFPVALVFGWLFDIGPEGIRRTLPEDAEAAAAELGLRRSDYLILAAFVAVAAVLVLQATRGVLETPVEPRVAAALDEPPVAVEKLENSIAVLPFENISDDPTNEYFCDGVAEEILNQLSGVGGLNVIGRTSSFAFKDSGYGIARISAALGVTYVLQGSVRKAGEQLRIAAQLLDEQGVQVWSQTFDRTLRDVFAIQTEIAGAVAGTVASQLAPQPARRHVPDLAAYEQFLEGRGLLHRRNVLEARKTLQRAIELDPELAEAYAELAIARLIGSPSEEELAEVDRLIERALALEPKLLRARAARVLWLSQSRPSDPVAVERAAREVLAQDPNMSDVLNWLHGALHDLGREEEALTVLKRAARVDPMHSAVAVNLAFDMAGRGEFDGAITHLRRAIEQPKPSHSLYLGLSNLLRHTGRLVELNEVARQQVLRLGSSYLGVARGQALLDNWSSVNYWLARSARDFPDHPWTIFFRWSASDWQGRYAEAAAGIERSFSESGLQLDEVGPDLAGWYAAMLARAGEYERAIEVLAPRIEAEGNFLRNAPNGETAYDGMHALAWSYLHTGAADQAASLLARVARQCLEEAAAGRMHLSDHVYHCAENALLIGDEDRALARLELAVAAGWRDIYVREHDPYWASLRDDPRYRELMQEVRADVDRQRVEIEALGLEEDFIAELDAAMASHSDT